MRRIPTTLALLAAVALIGGCNCGTDEPAVECATNEDCTGDLSYCNTETEECVECLEDEHCDEGQVCGDDFTCEEEQIVTGCESHDDCTEDGAEYCDVDSGECVECVEDAHCDTGWECSDNVCEEEVVVTDCDHDGFVAAEDESVFVDTMFGEVLAYQALSSSDMPADLLSVEWWFDYGAGYAGPGTYAVETDTTPADCGFCMSISMLDAAGETSRYFFAVDGEVEITEAGGDGQPFNGVLRDVVFVEWDFDAQAPLGGGEDWCIASFQFETILDGPLPAPPCSTHDDCTHPDFPYCNTDIGDCAECAADEHCDEGAGEECLNGVCRVPGACYYEGFSAAEDVGFFEIDQDGPVLGYLGNDDTEPPLDQLRVFWWFDYGADYQGPGVYPIETDSSLADCGLCVQVISFDAAGQFQRLYFATEGEVEITEIGQHGEEFAGVLRDAVLVEWDTDADVAVNDGLIYCIDDFEWSTEMDGTPPCLGHDDCTDPSAPWCDDGVCVECLTDEDCGAPLACEAGQCILTCDESGFNASIQYGSYTDDEDGPVLSYLGTTGADFPNEDILVSWRFDHGAEYIGAGLYAIDGSNLEDCGVCASITINDADGNIEALYFATQGIVEISEVGTDGETFGGVLRDMVFVEWDLDNDAMAGEPGVWCVDGHSWNTVMDGALPEFSCENDDHCTLPGYEYCHTGSGECVPCLADEHCNEWSECVDNACVFACDETGFDAVEETSSFSGSRLTYTAATSDAFPLDTLRIEWWGSFGAPFEGVGTYPIEEDSDYGSCGLCVLIQQFDANEDAVGYYFAIAGEIEVTEVDFDADLFELVLHDVVFVEWDGETDTAVDSGETWCIDGFTGSTPIPAGMPAPACQLDEDCTGETLAYCDTDAGVCVECVLDEHCEVEGEECLANMCLLPPEGNTCPDAIVVTESGTHSGAMAGYTNNFAPTENGTDSCTGFSANGPDIVFEVTLDPGEELHVLYTLIGGDESIYIVSECIDGEPPVEHGGVCLIGADESALNPEQVAYTNQGAEAETVYVILDAFTSSPAANATWEAVFTLTP